MNVFNPAPDQERALRDALGRFATGVCVVTTRMASGHPIAMTVNSFAAVSLNPPLVLWSPAKSSARFPAFLAADHFAIHVLEQSQVTLSARFSRGAAGFDGVSLDTGLHDLPLLNDCLASFECATEARHDGGDHTILVGKILRARQRYGQPLLFSAGRYGGFLPLPDAG